jgi:DNA-binding response OmpR family regulator
MPTILIVDCSDQERAMIRGLLSGKSSWKILDVASAAVAKDLLHEQPIDMILVDLTTAGLPEERFLDYLRREKTQVPVVLLTARTDQNSALVEALGIGAVSYVPKSMLARDLMITVERLLGLTGCRRRHAQLWQCLRETRCSYEIKGNNLSLLPAAIGHLVDTAEDFGVTTHGNRTQIALALDEAMTNGIIHGNLEVSSKHREGDGDAFYLKIREHQRLPTYSERTLFVEAAFEIGEARFTIRDEGPGFDPSQVADPTRRSNLDKPYGRGLFLIRAFMDEVLFNGRGNEITLVKRPPITIPPMQETAMDYLGCG